MTVPQLISTGAGAALVLVVDYRLLMVTAGVVLLGCGLSLLTARLPLPVDAASDQVDAALG